MNQFLWWWWTTIGLAIFASAFTWLTYREIIWHGNPLLSVVITVGWIYLLVREVQTTLTERRRGPDTAEQHLVIAQQELATARTFAPEWSTLDSFIGAAAVAVDASISEIHKETHEDSPR